MRNLIHMKINKMKPMMILQMGSVNLTFLLVEICGNMNNISYVIHELSADEYLNYPRVWQVKNF